ncbi:MAG: hypothetical protein R3181_13600 [Rubricoccaceae bacterium]|nr:hypothetical protein [Rubricoccaceae bacterium]
MRPTPRLLRAAARVSLLALLAVAAAGCDQDGLDLDGEFIADVSGDVSEAYTGEAYYTVFDGREGSVFVLIFFRGDLFDNDEDEYAYVALWRPGDQPGTGVYPIESAQTAPAAFAGSYADLIDAETPEASGPVVSATEGVLTITDFDAGFLSGSFRFDGRGLLLPDTDAFIDASVDGTFEARFLSPSALFSLPIAFDFD